MVDELTDLDLQHKGVITTVQSDQTWVTNQLIFALQHKGVITPEQLDQTWVMNQLSWSTEEVTQYGTGLLTVL